MYTALIVVSVIVLLCIFSTKALYRFGVPSLLVFLALGMVLGSEGVGGIDFNDFIFTEHISTVFLSVIIFFGGFGTKWEAAKPIVLKAALLSSVGTMMTAVVTGLLCTMILNVPFIYGFLFGAVIASTDAASVFSILRSRKLNLKGGLAPLLEVESGSNDPFAYMFTILVITVINADTTGGGAWFLAGSFALQIGLGIAFGAVVAVITVFVLSRVNLEITGLAPIMLLAIVVLSFSTCTAVGGNGLLAVYILGIIVGNNKILEKVSLVHFFDGLSWLMQIMLFFLLGLLSSPSKLLEIIVPGTLLSLLIIFVARPIAVFSILSWFKTPFKQQVLTAWVGLRGAASIVFAIVALDATRGDLPYDLFHLVFFVALFSILIQGSLLPVLSNKLELVDDDDENAVLKTFTDYYEDVHSTFFEYTIASNDKLADKRIVDSSIPEGIIIMAIKRGSDIITPKGATLLKENDILLASGDDFNFFNEPEKV
ncbi:MAG: potassium/proton antiporter [Oscillospiraceae bacterium]|nr:potassium/proton antiporter [Oscillospiraceae bacterium]